MKVLLLSLLIIFFLSLGIICLAIYNFYKNLNITMTFLGFKQQQKSKQ